MNKKFTSILVIIFAFSFFFSLGFNNQAVADAPEDDGDCCVVVEEGIFGVINTHGVTRCDCMGLLVGTQYTNPKNCQLVCPVFQ
ncbi:MAG: hypothetical protein KAR42_08705 [candidate division Zixibacteria bacterium]|nr:hypothetical protein [candidate division Zixibacteria bacterium]